MKAARALLQLGLVIALSAALLAQAPTVAPRIWDDAALVEWATPVATLNARPAHYSSAEYYRVPGDNLRTYPVYPPDREPPGYWEELQKKKPEPLVDVANVRFAKSTTSGVERVIRRSSRKLGIREPSKGCSRFPTEPPSDRAGSSP